MIDDPFEVELTEAEHKLLSCLDHTEHMTALRNLTIKHLKTTEREYEINMALLMYDITKSNRKSQKIYRGFQDATDAVTALIDHIVQQQTKFQIPIEELDKQKKTILLSARFSRKLRVLFHFLLQMEADTNLAGFSRRYLQHIGRVGLKFKGPCPKTFIQGLLTVRRLLLIFLREVKPGLMAIQEGR